jgi:hypothetical protein
LIISHLPPPPPVTFFNTYFNISSGKHSFAGRLFHLKNQQSFNCNHAVMQNAAWNLTFSDSTRHDKEDCSRNNTTKKHCQLSIVN